MLSPQSKYILAWNLITTIIYSVSIFIDTIVIGFHMTPLLVPDLQNTTTVFSAVMIIDVLIKFFVAFRANSANMAVSEDEEEEAMLHQGGGEQELVAQETIRHEMSLGRNTDIDSKKYNIMILNARAKDF